MSEQTQSVETVTEAAQRFAAGLAQTPEYEEFQAATGAYREDGEARKLLQKFQQAQERAQRFGPWGQVDTGTEEDVQSLQTEVMAHPVLARYFASQETLLQTLQETNAYLAEKLGFDFADLTKPAGGCC